jgi:hypothetical protein
LDYSCAAIVSALYFVARRLLEFVVLLGGGDRVRELEILVLRTHRRPRAYDTRRGWTSSNLLKKDPATNIS